MIYTTFSLLHQHGACESGYRKLAKHLGGVNSYGRDTPIALAVVLDSNGLDDALWCLRATTEPCDRLARLLAVAFAREVQHLMTDPRSLAALDTAERYAHGRATDAELAAANIAANIAANAAANAAAGNAARDAGAAAWAAAWAAARDAGGDAGAAAWAAAGDARDAARAAGAAARDAMRTRQVQIMREMLEAQ
jgi:hypothetical protein